MSTITRRGAIRSGALSAIGVGLMSAAGASPAFAAPQTIATVVHTDDLAAECQRLHTLMLKALHDEAAFEDQMSDLVGSALSIAYSNVVNTYGMHHQEWLIAEIARHLPGLAPTLRLLQNHIIMTAYQHPGACCTVAEGFEP